MMTSSIILEKFRKTNFTPPPLAHPPSPPSIHTAGLDVWLNINLIMVKLKPADT